MGKQIDYIAFYQQHIEGLKPTSGDEWKGHCPFPENHSGGIDRHPSLSINSKTGVYQCFSCGITGNLRNFCKEKGLPYPGQKQEKRQEPEAVFDYRDENGALLRQACKAYTQPGAKKKFWQRKPDGKGGYENNVKGVPNVPYRLQDIIEDNPDEWLFKPEGEKHVNRLRKLGLPATCNIGGAEKWTAELSPYLKGRKVCILPDNDPPGQSHADKVALSLQGIAKEIRIVNLPGLKDKGDIINWLDGDSKSDGIKHTKEELLKLTEQAKPWEPTSNQLAIPANRGKVEELNEKHAVIMLGGKCVVLNETVDYTFNRPEITFSTPRDFKDFYANQFVQITTKEGKEKSISLGKYWFEHKERRQFKGITFAPLKETPGYYNLWKGFAVEPKEGDCSLYLDHLWINVAQESKEIYDYLLAWMADCVQNPTSKPGTSIVLRGAQGTGKGAALEGFGKLLGNHYIPLQHARHLVGNFNAHLKEALLVFADEAFWAGDKSAEGVLKTMITEEYMQIEPKGKDAFRVKNHIHLMISSNNDWVVPAGLEERRFLILDIGEKHIQDHEYFNAITNQMNNEGREALLYYLQNYDLSGVNLRKIPQTEALFETKLLSMSLVEQFWFSRLCEGRQTDDVMNWDTALVTKVNFYNEFKGFCGKKPYIPTQISFSLAIKKLVPWLKDQRPNDGDRQRCYIFPPLEECRKYWETKTNSEGFDWENTCDVHSKAQTVHTPF